MSERPTPEQIAATHLSIHRRGNPSMRGPDRRDMDRAETLIAHMRHEGYVIVHPDDVPEQTTADAAWGPAWAEGWNACRAHIFGADT